MCSHFCLAPSARSIELRGTNETRPRAHSRSGTPMIGSLVIGGGAVKYSTLLVTAEARAEERLDETYNHSFPQLRSHHEIYAARSLEDFGMWSMALRNHTHGFHGAT